MLADSEILCSFCLYEKRALLNAKETEAREGKQYIYCYNCGVKTRLCVAKNHEHNGHMYCTNCFELIQIEKEKSIRKNLKEMRKLKKLEEKKNVNRRIFRK
jgi:hypothetical protein